VELAFKDPQTQAFHSSQVQTYEVKDLQFGACHRASLKERSSSTWVAMAHWVGFSILLLTMACLVSYIILLWQ